MKRLVYFIGPGTRRETYRPLAQGCSEAPTTFAVLKNLPCDLFLGAHGAYFGLKAKYEKMKPGAANPFIDPEGYKAYIAERDDTFRKEWERQKQNPGAPAR